MNVLHPVFGLTLSDAAELAGYPPEIIERQRERENSRALHSGLSRVFGACWYCGEPVESCTCEPPEAA